MSVEEQTMPTHDNIYRPRQYLIGAAGKIIQYIIETKDSCFTNLVYRKDKSLAVLADVTVEELSKEEYFPFVNPENAKSILNSWGYNEV